MVVLRVNWAPSWSIFRPACKAAGGDGDIVVGQRQAGDIAKGNWIVEVGRGYGVRPVFVNPSGSSVSRPVLQARPVYACDTRTDLVGIHRIIPIIASTTKAEVARRRSNTALSAPRAKRTPAMAVLMIVDRLMLD